MGPEDGKAYGRCSERPYPVDYESVLGANPHVGTPVALPLLSPYLMSLLETL